MWRGKRRRSGGYDYWPAGASVAAGERSGQRSVRRRPGTAIPDRRVAPVARYLTSTAAPASSSSALQLVGLLLVDALLDGLRGRVDERLGLLQAEAGRRADDLDRLDLLRAGVGEDDVEARLLLLGRGAVAAGRPAPAGAAAATAVADTPNSSSSALMRSDSSSTEMPLSSSIHSWVDGIGLSYFSVASSSPSASAGASASAWVSSLSVVSAGASAPASASGSGSARGVRVGRGRLGLGRRRLGLGRRRPRPGHRRRPGPAPRSGAAGWRCPAIRPLSPRTSPVIGAAIVPTSWACSTSRAGSRAIARSSSTETATPSITPPFQSSTCSARAKSAIAFAATRGVAAHERQRRRALEQRLEVLGAGLVGRTLGERVLDDPERRVGVAQARTQLGRLGHGDAAVVDREHRLRCAQLLGDRVDDGRLLFSFHPCPLASGLSTTNARAQAGVFE